jgi:hypothetical protein
LGGLSDCMAYRFTLTVLLYHVQCVSSHYDDVLGSVHIDFLTDVDILSNGGHLRDYVWARLR